MAGATGFATGPRGDFEVEGISDELCERFSKRHQQIDAALAELLKIKPELSAGNFKDLRERLATAERSRKTPDLGRTELRRLWQEQMTHDERENLGRLINRSGSRPTEGHGEGVKEAVAWAEEHLFDRHSVVSEHELWQTALERMRGANVEIDELKDVTRRRRYVRSETDQHQVTLPEVLHREWAIVMSVREGLRTCDALVASSPPPDPKLDEEQRKALQQLLQSSDRVILFRGGAGTGKSFVLGKLVEAVQSIGRPVTVLAPQRQQVADLKRPSFHRPQPLQIS